MVQTDFLAFKEDVTLAPTFTSKAKNVGNVFATPPQLCYGNLIKNGDFEKGLAHWDVDNVRTVTGRYTHSGRKAAGLGARCRNNRTATLSQTIEIPDSNTGFFQLIFHVAGRKDRPAALSVCLTWLDVNEQAISIGFQTRVQSRAIGEAPHGEWNTYVFVTGKLPNGAAFVRLHFKKHRRHRKHNFLIIDDVLLVPVIPVCF